MSILSALKLTAAQKTNQTSPVVIRRNKLAKRIWEQMELAKAQQNGETFVGKKFKTVTDLETGSRKHIETSKRIKQWWFVTESGKLALCVRYGSKILELSKGKYAIELSNAKELVGALEVVKNAVLNGELDVAIESAASKLREGFVH